MTTRYEITRFFKHPTMDRKVMQVRVTTEEEGTISVVNRELYWELPAYRNRSDEALVAEVRKLFGVKAEDRLDCPPFEDRPQ